MRAKQKDSLVDRLHKVLLQGMSPTPLWRLGVRRSLELVTEGLKEDDASPTISSAGRNPTRVIKDTF